MNRWSKRLSIDTIAQEFAAQLIVDMRYALVAYHEIRPTIEL